LFSKVSVLFATAQIARSSDTEQISMLALRPSPVDIVSGIVIDSFDVEDLVCAGPKSAMVVRPDDDKPYPLVSFAHGYGSGGEHVKEYYSIIMSNIASLGFTVVAAESGDGPTVPEKNCLEQWQDQLKVIEWAKTAASVKDFVAPGQAVLVGHSMGATTTLLAASEADPKQIAGAVAIHPHKFTAWGEKENPENAFDYSRINPKVPTLTLTGDVDEGNEDAYALFDIIKSSKDQQIIEVEGAMHGDSVDGNKNLEHPYIFEFIKCHLTDKAACSDIASATVSGVGVTAYKMR